MITLVKYANGPDGMEIREMPEPEAGPGDIKIRVRAVGICGTDIHIMQDEYPYNPPVIMGHEYVGEVVAAGADVRRFAVGDCVVSLTAKHTCETCVYCRQGLYMLCPERKSIGSGMHGAMAEYLTIPERLAYKVPEGVPYGDELAMSEPLACCVRAVLERSVVTAGDVVLISGPGTIGMLCLQLARLAGACVIVSGIERDRPRLELATRLGADAVAWDREQLVRLVKERAPLGVDTAFECAGAAASAETCLNMLRKQGAYTQVALYGKEIPFDFDSFLFKELTMYTTYAQEPTSWDRMMRVLETGKLELADLFDANYSLCDWKEAFAAVRAQKGFKIAMRP